jgi:hemolysin activation/secretion protein
LTSTATSSRAHALRRSGTALSLCAAAAAALAQPVPPPRPPSSGTLLQQLDPSVPQPPTLGNVPVDVSVPRAVTAPTAGGPKVQVKGFRIAGLPPERAQPLLPLLNRYVGPDKTLADLEDAAKDIEVALQRSGLFLAQAYVPEQNLSDGIVTLQVLEGRLGAVKIETEPGVKVSPELMDQIVAKLRGNPVAERELIEQALFTLGDLRGITATSTLTPGDKVGQADLTIKVGPSRGYAFSIEYDNAGSLYTGKSRIYAGADWYNAIGRGDVASLKMQLSEGSAFARLAWLTPINAVGTKFGIAASFLKYKLGTDLFDPLDAEGTASAFSLQLLHPQIRSRNHNLFLQASLDTRRFNDQVHAIALDSEKRIPVYGTLGVVGDFRDTVGGGGISNYSANIVAGKLDIQTPGEAAIDAAAFKTAGNYAKLVATASRLQVLPNKDYLFFGAQGQFASKDLDSSEKFSMGGPNGVRAYPSPESPSDSAVILTWEYRKPLRLDAAPGDWVASVFGDYGYAKLHETPLPNDPTDNTRYLMSHGLGMTYGNTSGLLVKAWVAVRGGTPAQSDDSRTRWVLQLSQQF